MNHRLNYRTELKIRGRNKCLQIHLVAIILVFLASCATETGVKQESENIDNKELVLLGNPEILYEVDTLWGMTEDKNGDIWVGKLAGVFRYDGNSVSYFMDGE